MAIKDISDTGDQVLRKAAVDLLTGGQKGLDYALRIKSVGDFWLSVANGDIPGVKGLNKFGFNPAVGPANLEDIWDGSTTYIFQTVARTVNLSSSSPNDTAAGTGARTVRLEGLDLNYIEINETIIMDGTSDVLSLNSYLRLDRMIVKSAGSNEHNIGNITAISTTDTNLMAQISVNNGQTLMAIFTIPAGKTGFLVDWTVNTTSPVEVDFFIRPFGEAFQIKRKIITAIPETEMWNPYLLITEKSDLRVEAKSASGNNEIGSNFDILLVDN